MFTKLDPWNITETEFPLTGTITEKLKFLLNYAVLAPSSHNTQPWCFKVENEAIYLEADRTRALPITDPQGRELIISCGTALFNLRMALHHFGYAGRVVTFPEPSNLDLLACIQLGDVTKVNPDDNLLFEAIKRRHTNRRDFDDWDIPQSLLSWLKQDAILEGAWLHISLHGNSVRNAVAELVIQGDRLQMADPNFRRELAAWIHKSDSQSHDGIPIYAFGVDKHLDFATPIFALVMRNFDLGDAIANHSRQLLERSPAIAVLGTEGDTPADWLAAGQALQRILLRGQAIGFTASFFNQPIEVPQLRSKLVNLIYKSGYPQIILRLGFGSQLAATPRRAVEEVTKREKLADSYELYVPGKGIDDCKDI